MFFPAQCSLPSPVPHLESDFYWLIFTEEVLSRVVTIRPLRPSFEIFFVGIFSLKKKNQKPSVQRLLRGRETAKGPRQHQGLPHFLPSQLLTLSSVPFFSFQVPLVLALFSLPLTPDLRRLVCIIFFLPSESSLNPLLHQTCSSLHPKDVYRTNLRQISLPFSYLLLSRAWPHFSLPPEALSGFEILNHETPGCC